MWLRKGEPVIVDLTGRYSVVSGLTESEIILEDPAIGRKRPWRQLFISLWYDFNYLSPRKNGDLVMRHIVAAPAHLLEGRKNGIPASDADYLN